MEGDELKKILIVEDEEVICRSYADELRDEGFLVATAENGQTGLETAFKEKPDLILLDILMPVMDGMAMMKKLRQDAWGKNVPIIILTNLSATENMITGIIKDEPLFFLAKSEWNLKDVVEKIRKALNR